MSPSSDKFVAARPEPMGPYSVTRLLLPEIEELLDSAPEDLADVLEEIHAADLAELTHKLPRSTVQQLLAALPPALSADLAEYLSDEARSDLVSELPPDQAADILEEMEPDDRADLLSDLEPHEAEAILDEMEVVEREEARQLLEYPETSAGGLMTTQYVTLNVDLTVGQAIERIRGAAREGAEVIYAGYVTNGAGQLTGVLSLKDMLAENPNSIVGAVMDQSILSVSPLIDQEEVARVISKYDLLAIPVLEPDSGRLVGIVTVDDILDVLVEEGTEDAHRMGAVEPFEEPYIKAEFWLMVRKRASWLLVLFFGVFLTSAALKHYEAQLERAVVLMFFLPLIISSGGNSGSQSATLIIRSMAVHEIELKDFLRVFYREIKMGLVLGLFLGVCGFLSTFLWGMALPVQVTVTISLIAVVILGTIAGSMLPMMIAAVKMDPAVTSAPFIASLVDVVGIVFYLEIAKAIMGI